MLSHRCIELDCFMGTS